MVGAPTFTWPLSNDSNVESVPPVLMAKFGDGYVATVPDGLKTIARTVNVDVSPIEMPEALLIMAFLDTQGGMPFWWTPIPPLAQVECQWTCVKYGFKPGGGITTGITATFVKFNSPSVN